MAELSFTYGLMGTGKSTLALQLRQQLAKRGPVALWSFGDRVEGRVSSRLGIWAEADGVTPGSGLQGRVADLVAAEISHLVVDEAQFATPAQVEELAEMVDRDGVPVSCFGLLSDYRGELFPGSAKLLVLADSVSELPLPQLCWCGARGRCHALLIGGEMHREGVGAIVAELDPGSEETGFVVLCRRHWREGRAAP